MKSVVAPLYRFSSLVVANVYLLDGGPGDRWLIDSGHWSERWQLLAELRASGFRASELTGVLLTHRHSDHAGNAKFLQEKFGLKIVAHRADAEVLAEQKPRPRLGSKGNFLEKALSAVENTVPARVVCDHWLDHNLTIAGLQVHSVPGHTDGSVFYYHPTTQALLTGDTLLTARPPLTLTAAVLRAHDAFSADTAMAHSSLDAFNQAGPHYEHVLAGHGKPLVGRAKMRVMDILDSRK